MEERERVVKEMERLKGGGGGREEGQYGFSRTQISTGISAPSFASVMTLLLLLTFFCLHGACYGH